MVEYQYSLNAAYLLEFTLYWVYKAAGADGRVPCLLLLLPVAHGEDLGQQTRGKSLAT